MCKYFSWKNTKGKKKKTKTAKENPNVSVAVTFWEGPRWVKVYQENYRVKITNSIKRGRRGKSRVNLVLGVRNSALGTADLPWGSLGAHARHRSHRGKIQKGTQDGIAQSWDFCRDGSSSGFCRSMLCLVCLCSPFLGGVSCSPGLAHSSSVYRAVHIYHIYHLQVHMSYPGREIFPVPPSPSALPVSASTGAASQTNLTTEVILFYFYFLPSRWHKKKENSSVTSIILYRQNNSTLCNPLWKIIDSSSPKTP